MFIIGNDKYSRSFVWRSSIIHDLAEAGDCAAHNGDIAEATDIINFIYGLSDERPPSLPAAASATCPVLGEVR